MATRLTVAIRLDNYLVSLPSDCQYPILHKSISNKNYKVTWLYKKILLLFPPLEQREIYRLTHICTLAIAPQGGYFLGKDYWGCDAGWGRILTT